MTPLANAISAAARYTGMVVTGGLPRHPFADCRWPYPCWSAANRPAPWPVPEPEALFGDALRLPLSSLAVAGEADGELRWSVWSDPSLATVRIIDGHLLVIPEPGAEGIVEVAATATDRHGQTATVRFEVPVEFYWPTSPTRGWRSALPNEPPAPFDQNP